MDPLDLTTVIPNAMEPSSSQLTRSGRKKRVSTYLSLVEKTRVVNVYNFVKKTWPPDKESSKTAMKIETARILGICLTTVFRTLKEYSLTGTVLPPVKQRRHTFLDEKDNIDKVQNIVESFYLKGEEPSLNKILQVVHRDESMPNYSKTTVRRILKNLNISLADKIAGKARWLSLGKWGLTNVIPPLSLNGRIIPAYMQPKKVRQRRSRKKKKPTEPDVMPSPITTRANGLSHAVDRLLKCKGDASLASVLSIPPQLKRQFVTTVEVAPLSDHDGDDTMQHDSQTGMESSSSSSDEEETRREFITPEDVNCSLLEFPPNPNERSRADRDSNPDEPDEDTHMLEPIVDVNVDTNDNSFTQIQYPAFPSGHLLDPSTVMPPSTTVSVISEDVKCPIIKPTVSLVDEGGRKVKRKYSHISGQEKLSIINTYNYIEDKWPKANRINKTAMKIMTANLLGISKTTVYRTLKEYAQTGTVKPPPPPKKRPSLLDEGENLDKVKFIVESCYEKNDKATLDAITDAVHADESLPKYSKTTLRRIMKQLKIYRDRKPHKDRYGLNGKSQVQGNFDGYLSSSSESNDANVPPSVAAMLGMNAMNMNIDPVAFLTHLNEQIGNQFKPM